LELLQFLSYFINHADGSKPQFSMPLDLFQNCSHTLASPNAERGKTKGMLLSEHLPQ
jgi:hypothetical protein